MKTIRLYGELARKFGRSYRLDVKSPAEAVRALSVMVPGFRQHLTENSEPGYQVRLGETPLSADEIVNPSSVEEVIKIIPVVYGRGDDGLGQIIVGIVLIAVAWWNPFGWGALGGSGSLAAGTAGGAATTAMGVVSIGASLVIGGVSQMLAPAPPKIEGNERPENKPSYAFDGPVNTVASGHPVSIGYGRLLVGSQVVSAELFTVEEPV